MYKHRVTEVALYIIYKSHIQVYYTLVYYTLMFSAGKGKKKKKTFFMAIRHSLFCGEREQILHSLIYVFLQNCAVKKVSFILPFFGVR